jgi:diguanylate cyclase (GGDEF)-like protein
VSFAKKPPRPVPPHAGAHPPSHGRAGLEVAALRKLQPFQEIDTPTLDALASRAGLLDLGADECLLRKGEPNPTAYVVVSGRLRVELDSGGPPLLHLGRGEIVGELSLLAGSFTTATVAAEEPTRLVVLDEETFWWLARSSHEFSVGLLVRLANRMRVNNETVQANIAMRRQFEHAALNDPLTGVRNRRWLDQTLPRFVQRHLHEAQPLCIAVMDIDHFKNINDRFGHPAGDAVLAQVGQLVRANLRPSDFAARTGGEEFVLIFPQTTLPGAFIAAERLREAIASSSFGDGALQLPQVTVSLGMAELQRSADAVELVARADAALYRAKHAGRNRTEGPPRES